MKITVTTRVRAPIDTVWQAWNNPQDICAWNAASDDWHTTGTTVDLREGGSFTSRMEAKDGSAGFDFAGTYTRVEAPRYLAYVLEDGREVTVQFEAIDDAVTVTETFNPDDVYPAEYQQAGWQSILDNFTRYVEARV